MDILKTGKKSQIINYIETHDTFSIDEYKLLVQNILSGHDYIILLIKYKYNVLPSLELVNKDTGYKWIKPIIKNLDVTIYEIINYLHSNNIKLGYRAYAVITQTKYKTSIQENEIEFVLNYFISQQNNWWNLIGWLVNNQYKGSIEKVLDILDKTNIKIPFNKVSVNSREYFLKLSKVINTINNTFIIKFQKYLTNNKDVSEFAEIIKDKNQINITFNLLEKVSKHCKELVKLIPIVYHSYYINNFNFDLVFKYYNLYPELYQEIKFEETTGCPLQPNKSIEYNCDRFLQYIKDTTLHTEANNRMLLYFVSNCFNGEREIVKQCMDDLDKGIKNKIYLTTFEKFLDFVRFYSG